MDTVKRSVKLGKSLDASLTLPFRLIFLSPFPFFSFVPFSFTAFYPNLVELKDRILHVLDKEINETYV